MNSFIFLRGKMFFRDKVFIDDRFLLSLYRKSPFEQGHINVFISSLPTTLPETIYSDSYPNTFKNFSLTTLNPLTFFFSFLLIGRNNLISFKLNNQVKKKKKKKSLLKQSSFVSFFKAAAISASKRDQDLKNRKAHV